MAFLPIFFSLTSELGIHHRLNCLHRVFESDFQVVTVGKIHLYLLYFKAPKV